MSECICYSDEARMLSVGAYMFATEDEFAGQRLRGTTVRFPGEECPLCKRTLPAWCVNCEREIPADRRFCEDCGGARADYEVHGMLDEGGHCPCCGKALNNRDGFPTVDGKDAFPLEEART